MADIKANCSTQSVLSFCLISIFALKTRKTQFLYETKIKKICMGDDLVFDPIDLKFNMDPYFVKEKKSAY